MLLVGMVYTREPFGYGYELHTIAFTLALAWMTWATNNTQRNERAS